MHYLMFYEFVPDYLQRRSQFRSDTADVPERFAAAGPYVSNGLVKRRWVRPWTTVVGEEAFTLVHSEG